MSHTKVYILVLLPFLMFIISGCSRLQWLDQKAGELFFNQAAPAPADVKPEDKNINGGFSVAPPDAADLTQEQKDKIDKWLTDNNLNRYGDKMGTFYTGGTPLFDEMTGKSKERFEYILEKMPDILDKIGK